MATAAQPITTPPPPQAQGFDPLNELRARYPGVAKEPDEKVYHHLSDPNNFRAAFPEYAHLDDETITRNMAQHAPSEQARQGVVTPGAAPMKAQTQTEFEKNSPVAKPYYGFTPSNMATQAVQGVKELGSGIKDTVHDIGNLSWSDLAKKYLFDPADAESKKAQTAKTSSESVGHSVAAAIPLLGPWAASLGEQAGTGDVGGAAARGGSQFALGEAAKGVSKVARPIVGKAGDVAGRTLRDETGNLRPVVHAASRGLGAWGGSALGIPGAEIAGMFSGPALMDALTPGREPTVAKAVPLTRSPYYTQNKAKLATQAKEAKAIMNPLPKIVTPDEGASPRRIDSEGRPATWTGEDLDRLAAEGNRNAITQKVLRGKELGPNQRYVMGDPSMSNLEYSPREVTRFAPDGTPIRQGGKVSPIAQPLNRKQPALLPESSGVPQGNPTPYSGPERRTSSSYDREIFQKMLNNPEGEKLGQSMKQAREGSVGAESEGPARLAIMRSPEYPKFRAAELSGDTATMREMLIKAKQGLPRPAKPLTH